MGRGLLRSANNSSQKIDHHQSKDDLSESRSLTQNHKSSLPNIADKEKMDRSETRSLVQNSNNKASSNSKLEERTDLDDQRDENNNGRLKELEDIEHSSKLLIDALMKGNQSSMDSEFKSTISTIKSNLFQQYLYLRIVNKKLS